MADPAGVVWDDEAPQANVDQSAVDSKVKWDDEDAPSEQKSNALPNGQPATGKPWEQAITTAFAPPKAPGIAEAADTAAALASSAIVGAPSSGVAGLGARVKAAFTGEDPDKASQAAHQWVDQNMVYHPQTEGGREALGAVGNAIGWEAKPFKQGEQAAEEALGPTGGKLLHTAVGTTGDILNAAPIVPAAGAALDLAKSVPGAARNFVAGQNASLETPYADAGDAGPRPASDAQSVLSQHAANSPQSMGAAATAPSVEGTSPELQQAIANSQNPNMEAVHRHINAETLPMPAGQRAARLRAGQAARDDQQISDEKNMRTVPDPQVGPVLTDSITAQNDSAVASMGEIRQQATPDIVHKSNLQHGQTAVDEMKQEDNVRVMQTRADYKALADANGGAIPIDRGAVMADIAPKIKTGGLRETVKGNDVLSEVQSNLTSGEPIDFDTFEGMRTRLAELQRTDKGSAGTAAGIFHDALNKMPLSAEAAPMRDLADAARNSAYERFQLIKRNPAYKAVVNDNGDRDPETGLHVTGQGAPTSPLADSFMDRYILGRAGTASQAYVERLQNLMKARPEFSKAVEAASLNKLRDAAGIDAIGNGGFNSGNFRTAVNGMEDDSHLLMRPETWDKVQHLKRYSDDISYEGKASSTSRSNTPLVSTNDTLKRFGAQFLDEPKPMSPGREAAGHVVQWGGDLAAAGAGHFGYPLKKVGEAGWNIFQKGKRAAAEKASAQSIIDAQRRFAAHATAPGAGIESPALPPITRASGGRVDHDALVAQLMTRWHAARKDANRHTEPLLNLPDDTITKALRVAHAQMST